jgi:D-alanine-D-alanine ligase-like ATP-grasp enzyme
MSCLKLNQDGDIVINNSIGRITNEQFVLSLRETWCSDYRETAFLKDIPRLIKRLQIQVKNCEIHGPYIDDHKVDAILKSLEIICQDLQMDSTQIQAIREELSK